MKYTPHEYQKRAIKFMISQGAAGLFLDPGLGKTSITYGAFNILKKQGLHERMLVIAPLRPALSVWPREKDKWDDFKHLRVRVLHGKEKRLDGDEDIQVINPEGLDWYFQEVLRGYAPPDVLVVDESTKFKHGNTKRFHALRPHLGRFRRRYILTGSPAPNGLLDLWGQAFILDMGHALEPFITRFKRKYFYQTGFGGFQWVIKSPEAVDEIYRRLAPLVLRMRAEDYLELPELIENEIEVQLPPAVMKTYAQMEDMLFTKIDEQGFSAASVAAALVKCRQIANGGLYRDGSKEFVHLHKEKIEAVVDLVEQLQGTPALIAYEFQHDLARLRDAFPGAPNLGGGTTPHRQREVEDAWNAGQLPVLLAQPASVAHGLNLQGTRAAVIFHSLSYNLEDDEQFIQRVWRQGQQDRVFVYRVVAAKTVDQAIVGVLRRKDKEQSTLLSALEEYRRSNDGA